MDYSYKELRAYRDILPEDYSDILMTTKADIQAELSYRMSRMHEVSTTDNWHSAKYYGLLESMLIQFKAKLEATILPKQLEPWWRYSYEISHKGIRLYLEHIRSLWIDLDIDEVDEETVDQVFLLISVDATMLTVDEYAKIYGVEQVTVRQWIRRGKLRGAEKAGKEWRISELTDVPRPGRFEPMEFKWISELKDVPEGFEVLHGYSSIHIVKRDLNRSEDYPDKNYYASLSSRADRYENAIAIMLTDKEKAILEAYLIANPDVLYTGDTRVRRIRTQ